MQNLHTQGSRSETQLTYYWMCAHTHPNTHTHAPTHTPCGALASCGLIRAPYVKTSGLACACVCVFQSAAPVTEGGRVTQTENTGGCQRKWKGDRGVTQVCAVVNSSLKLRIFVLEIEEESFLVSSKVLSPLALSPSPLTGSRLSIYYLLHFLISSNNPVSGSSSLQLQSQVK